MIHRGATATTATTATHLEESVETVLRPDRRVAEGGDREQFNHRGKHLLHIFHSFLVKNV